VRRRGVRAAPARVRDGVERRGYVIAAGAGGAGPGKERYNREWLCERHGHQTPAAIRARAARHRAAA
jgi:hypothetical protein